MSLIEALEGAWIVRSNTERGYVLAWFGGHCIHAYSEDGTEIGYWIIGDFAYQEVTEEEVIEDMTEEIRTGDYLKRY